MLLFRSEEHVDRWCERWSTPRGGLLTLDQGWQLARAWYAPDRRSAQWRRHPIEEAEALFRQLGLRGSFWNLR